MKITQKQAVFYKLYAEYRKDSERFVPTWEFVGELFIIPFNKWVMMSYKCPARLSDLMKENPGLLIRKDIRGKSGSNYYGYRFKTGVTIGDIMDIDIGEFYYKIQDK